jgi:hypothetical protein
MMSSLFSRLSSLLSRTRQKIGTDPAAIQRMTIGRAIPNGMIDSLQVEPAGLIRVEGWHTEAVIPSHLLPSCRWNEEPIPLSQVYRTWRPDVSSGIFDKNFLFRGGSIGGLFLLVKGYFASCCIEKQGLAMRF